MCTILSLITTSIYSDASPTLPRTLYLRMPRHNFQGKPLTRKERDARIWELRARGLTIYQVAAELGCSTSKVRSSLHRVAEEYQVEFAADIIKMELDRLDIMLRKAMEVLHARHLAFSHGRLLRDDEDNLLNDSAPVLQAINSVLKIMERRSQYLGLDAPSKSEQSITVTNQHSEQQLALLQMIEKLQQNSTSLTPEQLDAHSQAALPQEPQHTIINLPADHFTVNENQPEKVASS